jgi:hypothetical protein
LANYFTDLTRALSDMRRYGRKHGRIHEYSIVLENGSAHLLAPILCEPRADIPFKTRPKYDNEQLILTFLDLVTPFSRVSNYNLTHELTRIKPAYPRLCTLMERLLIEGAPPPLSDDPLKLTQSEEKIERLLSGFEREDSASSLFASHFPSSISSSPPTPKPLPLSSLRLNPRP